MKKNLKWIIIIIVLLICAVGFFLFNNSKYEVTIQDEKGNTIEKIKVDKNSKIEDLKAPEKEGYEFLYWTIDNKTVDGSKKVSKNMILVPVYQEKYEANDFTVSFDTDGGSVIEPVVVIKGNAVSEPAIPEKEGFVFVRWELNGETYDFNTPVNKDITLKAKWEKVEDNKKVYTVTFDTDGGEAIQPKEVVENSKVEAPSKPIKVGYNFKEWQLNGKKYDFNTPVTKNITLKAIWTINANDNTVIVSFDTSGGTKISNQRIEKGKKVQRPSNPVKNGFVFVEWQLNGKKYDFNTPVTKSMTLKASWKQVAVVQYTVTFDTDNGSSIKSQIVSAGNKITKPSDPTKNGYTFVEWQLNGKKYDFNTPVTSNITLKAIWKENAPITYTVKFDSNGGSTVSSQTVKKGEKASTPSNPTYSGHTFKEWQLNGTKYDFNTPVTSNITLKATWINNEWEINSSGEIVKYKGSSAEVTIPNKIDGITPVKILSGAFASNNLTKVWLAKSITTIEANAFNKENNNNLTRLYMTDAQFKNNDIRKALNLTGTCTRNTKKGTLIYSEITKGGGALCGGSHSVSDYTKVENIDGIYPISLDVSGCISGVYMAEIPYYLSTEEYPLNDPTFSGFTFNGWTGEGITEPTKKVVIPAGSTGKKSYKASCTKNS
jgi:uncharacterized repeat protein (TIGR02543 family)